MPIYAATVTIKKRDNTGSATVEMVVVSGREIEDMKRNPDNLRRALRWKDNGGKGRVSKEDEMRWVITTIIIHKKLSD